MEDGERFVAIIRRDVDRTFTEFPAFHEKRSTVFGILKSFVYRHPEIGYTQGMNFVAGSLLLKSNDPRWAEQTFEDLMKKMGGFWMEGFPQLESMIPVFWSLFKKKLKNLEAHFNEQGIEPLSFLPSGWMTLFVKWMPLPAHLCVLDMIIQDGMTGIFSITLVLLEIHQHRFLRMSGENILQFFTHGMQSSPLVGETVLQRANTYWRNDVDDWLKGKRDSSDELEVQNGTGKNGGGDAVLPKTPPMLGTSTPANRRRRNSETEDGIRQIQSHHEGKSNIKVRAQVQVPKSVPPFFGESNFKY